MSDYAKFHCIKHDANSLEIPVFDEKGTRILQFLLSNKQQLVEIQEKLNILDISASLVVNKLFLWDADSDSIQFLVKHQTCKDIVINMGIDGYVDGSYTVIYDY